VTFHRYAYASSIAVIAILISMLVSAPADAATVSARSLLSRLEVRAESGSASYARSTFQQWTDEDHDGCDTRAEVLMQESRGRVIRGAQCRVQTGRWTSWYDGKTWTRASDVDIDHLVPLKEAWESGSRSWSAGSRTSFTNDLAFPWTLNAMTDNLNSAKQDRDPAGWLPPKATCRYATQWVAVKFRWGLTIDRREKAKLAAILRGPCGVKRLAVPSRASLNSKAPSPVATPTPVVTPTRVVTPTPVVTPTTPVAITPQPEPTTATPAPQPTYSGVTPGAFCGDHYAFGYTSAGTLMQCKTSASDSRFRWRAA
jgi:hypothetical protein